MAPNLKVIFLIKIAFHRDCYNMLACLLYSSVLTFWVSHDGASRLLAKFQIRKHGFVSAAILMIMWGFKEVPFSRRYLGNVSFLDVELEWVVSFNGYSGNMYLFLVSLVEILKRSFLLKLYFIMIVTIGWLAFYIVVCWLFESIMVCF